VSHPDHAALQNSDLNHFLYADVGTDSNGATLTMLSLLARLDQDPWVEAARWARLPKAVAVDGLIPIIASVQLTASDTRAAAARLVMLLPAPEWRPGLTTASLPSKTPAWGFGTSIGATSSPQWLPIALLAYALIMFLALTLAHSPGNSTVSTELTQSKVQAPAAESR
jgi:hypothetical protein